MSILRLFILGFFSRITGRLLPAPLLLGSVILMLEIFGCAAKIPQTAPPVYPTPQTGWQCSEKADQAMADGDIETGLHEHARFVAQHPNNPLAHYHLGYAFGQVGDIKQEIAHYEKAVSLGYDDNDQLFFNLGMAYGESGQLEKAIDAFEKSLAIAPESGDALAELSRLYRETGDKKNERRMLERLLKLAPENDTIKERIEALDAQ